VNLEEVLQIPEVDFSRCQSNDIVEILHVMGIEATRNALLFHVRMVISFDGSYVNYRHLGTLCDVMCQRGHLMAITRHGVNRTNMGPLMKCSFEETVEILMDAAIYAETDYMRAVSENVIMGQMCPVGTGVFDLYVDDKPDGPFDPKPGTIALDFASPTLPHMKGDVGSGGGLSGGDSPLPGPTPLSPSPVAMATDSPGERLPTPKPTPGDEDEGLGRSAARSPFSPFRQPDANMRSPAEMSSPASPAEAQFRSPSYTPASVSPTGTEHADGNFSPSYASAASPAYTPSGTSHVPTRPEDNTTSPSYHSMLGGSSQYAGAGWSPTSDFGTSPGYAPGRGAFADATSPGTSPGYSPMVAPKHATPGYEPTSPAGADMSDSAAGYSQAPTSPLGQQPMSPMVQARDGMAPASPDYAAGTASPSYTPQPGAGLGNYAAEFEQGGADVISPMAEGESGDEGMFDHDEDVEETDY